MRNKKVFVGFLFSMASLLFIGCMRQAPQSGFNPRGGGGGSLTSGLNSSVFSGAGSSAGGSGAAGTLTQPDQTALQNMANAAAALSVNNDPNAQKLGIDSAISQELTAEINRLIQRERAGENVLDEKWLLVPKIIEGCAAKVSALVPKPGEPLIGEWSGRGACGLGTFSINGPGNKQVYSGEIRGAQNVQVAAYNDGRFELRSNKWNGNGKDSAFQGQNLSGTGVLTTQTARATKYGTAYDPCQARVELVNSRSPIPENYKTALKVMGGCYRNAMALIGMDPILKKMNPQLSQVLFQQMLK